MSTWPNGMTLDRFEAVAQALADGLEAQGLARPAADAAQDLLAKAYGFDDRRSAARHIEIEPSRVLGVAIESRYGWANEVVEMRRAVEALPEDLRSMINRVYCDSKTGDAHRVTLEPEAIDRSFELSIFAGRLTAALSEADLLGGPFGIIDVEWGSYMTQIDARQEAETPTP